MAYEKRIELYNKLSKIGIKKPEDCTLIKEKLITTPNNNYVKQKRFLDLKQLATKIMSRSHKIKCNTNIGVNFQYVRLLTYNFEQQLDKLETIITTLGDTDETVPMKIKLISMKKKLHKINYLITNETCDNIDKITKYTDELVQDIPKFEKVIKFLNKGGSGKIFTSCIKDLCFSIKSMNIYEFFLKKENIMNTRFNRWREIQVLKWSTELILAKKTQNLPLFYDYQICWNKEMSFLLLYNELADGTFKKWSLTSHNTNEWRNFLVQYLYVVYLMQKKYSFVHNDLTWDNILFLKTDANKTWKYSIDDIEFYVKDMGYVFVLWDFGSCQSLKFNNKPGEREQIISKLKANKDLDYFFDLPKRIMMTLLVNRYSLDEMKILMNNSTDRVYLDKETHKVHEEVKRFNDPEREMYILQKNLAFYLVEQNRFDKLFEQKKTYFKPEDEVVIPPKEIVNLLNNWNSSPRRETSYYLKQFINDVPGTKPDDSFIF